MRRGRVPIVPWVRCADPLCGRVIAQRWLPWSGDAIWIQCWRCRKFNRVDAFGVDIVVEPGADHPVAVNVAANGRHGG